MAGEERKRRRREKRRIEQHYDDDCVYAAQRSAAKRHEEEFSRRRVAEVLHDLDSSDERDVRKLVFIRHTAEVQTKGTQKATTIRI